MAPEGEKEGNISELLTRNAKLDQILSQIVKKIIIILKFQNNWMSIHVGRLLKIPTQPALCLKLKRALCSRVPPTGHAPALRGVS